jgi:hypothetical protein
VRSVAILSLLTIVSGAACSHEAATPPTTPTAPPTPTCAFSVSINTVQFGPGGGAATATVGTSAACTWSATAEADWIAIDGGTNRAGDGTVSMAIKPFDSASDRTASITVAQQAFKLTQNGCLIRLSDAEISFEGDGGAKDIRIEADAACRWTAEGDLSWSSLEPATGTGSAVTRVRAGRNQSTAARTAAVRVGRQTLTLHQAGGSEPPSPTPPPRSAECVYSVTPVEEYVHSQGGTGTVNVSAPPGCTWTATASLPAHIRRGSSGTGSGVIEYAVDPNPETYVVDFRKVALEVRWPTPTAGQNVWLSQFGNCGGAGNRLRYTIPAAGGRIDDVVLVESPFTCPWRVQGGADWLTVLPAPDIIYRGDRNLHVMVAPNTTGETRTAELIIAERIYVITQVP